MTFKTDNASGELAEKVNKLLTTSPLILVKKTKSGEKEVDIVPLIRSADVGCADGTIILNTTLSASVGDFLNPELVINGLKQKLGILSHDPSEEWYTVLRKAVRKKDLTLFR